MSKETCDIFCIYPHDRTTFFLDRIQNYLKKELKDKFHCFKVKPNTTSHEDCLSFVKGSERKLILFMGHGDSQNLYGAIKDGDTYTPLYSGDNFQGEPFNNEQFINESNIGIFQNHVVISFSCNSNQRKNSLASSALENGGTKAFMGFGYIQTDEREKGEEGLTRKELKLFKGLLVNIFKKALSEAYHNRLSVEGICDKIKILTNREIYRLLKYNKKKGMRDNLIKHLFNFRKEIKVYGDKNNDSFYS